MRRVSVGSCWRNWQTMLCRSPAAALRQHCKSGRSGPRMRGRYLQYVAQQAFRDKYRSASSGGLNVAKLGRIPAKFARFPSNSGRIWSNSGLAEFGPNCVEIRPNLSGKHRLSSAVKFVRLRSSRLAESSADFGPKLAECRPVLDDSGPTSAGIGPSLVGGISVDSGPYFGRLWG